MPSFVRLEVWSESNVGGAGGVLKAQFDTTALVSASLQESLAGTEQLTFAVSRSHTDAAEIVHGRVVRICRSDTTDDTEWRISDDQTSTGAGDTGLLVVTCQPLYLDLARAPYYTHDSAGRATTDFSATQLTATQWLAYVVTACTAAPLPYTVSVGTVEFTNTFDLQGDFSTALEIIRAIQQPGRAPGDFRFRRNGTTDYKLDLLASRGSTAATVRVQTAKNLLAQTRKRSLANLGTKIIPRGMQGCATRDLSQTYWKVASVDSGTTATLSDPYGGAAPGAYTDQLKNLYVARIASTFSSQQITASTSGSQITVGSTAGWSAGDFVRLFTTSGSAGKRVISLSHPTRVLSPAAGGYGPVTRILDMPAAFGDTNLITSNAWLNTWTTAANAPDGFTRSSTLSGVWSRDTSVLKIGNYSQKIANSTTGGQTELTRFYSPTATPYTTAGLRFCASAWYYCDTVSSALQRYVRIRVMKPDLSVSYADGDYLDPAEIVGTWTKISLENMDLSAASAGVVVMLEVSVNNDPNGYAYHTSYFGPMTLSESDVPIEDVLYSGGIAMWQRANTLLNQISTPVAGYELKLADLARLDSSAWSDEPLVLGGNVELTDSDLSLTTTQRIIELRSNLLAPLEAEIQLQTAEPLATQAIAGLTPGSVINGAVSPVVVVAPAEKKTTVADYGITDCYTKTQVDALLAGKAEIGTGGQGNGVPVTVGGLTYTANGTFLLNTAGGVAFNLYTWNTYNRIELLEIYGYDASGGGNEFVDVLALSTFGTPAVGVISSTVLRGTVGARTYTISTATLQQAIAGVLQYNVVTGIRRAVLA